MRPDGVLHDARIVFLFCQLAHQGICGFDVVNLILTDNIIQPQLVSATHEHRAFVKLYRLAELINSFGASGCRLGCFQMKVKLFDVGRNLQFRISPVSAAFTDDQSCGLSGALCVHVGKPVYAAAYRICIPVKIFSGVQVFKDFSR